MALPGMVRELRMGEPWYCDCTPTTLSFDRAGWPFQVARTEGVEGVETEKDIMWRNTLFIHCRVGDTLLITSHG